MRDARCEISRICVSAMKVVRRIRGIGKVARFDDTSPAKINSAWAGVLEVEVPFVLYLAQKRPMLVSPELAPGALPNPATLVPKGR